MTIETHYNTAIMKLKNKMKKHLEKYTNKEKKITKEDLIYMQEIKNMKRVWQLKKCKKQIDASVGGATMSDSGSSHSVPSGLNLDDKLSHVDNNVTQGV